MVAIETGGQTRRLCRLGMATTLLIHGFCELHNLIPARTLSSQQAGIGVTRLHP